MSNQFAEIVGLTIENAVQEVGGSENDLRTFFDKAGLRSSEEYKILLALARKIVRGNGGQVKRKRRTAN